MDFKLSQFVHYDNEMSQDASTLGISPGIVPGSKLSPKSFGIKVTSDRTGKCFSFHLDEEQTTRYGWSFINHDVECPISKCSIFND